MEKSNNEFAQCLSLTDLGNVAALIEAGFELLSLDRGDPKKVRFIFKGKAGLNQAVKDYWDSKLTVIAQNYFNTIRRLKNQIYSE